VCVLAGGLAFALALAAGTGTADAQSSIVGQGESIQKAINAADPGDTIVVSGTHREDVVIRKNGISLRGINNATLRPPARADSPCSRIFGPEAICVFGDANLKTGEVTSHISDVSISGFTIQGFKQEANEGFTTIMIDVFGARNVTIVGNRVIGNAGAEIGITAEGLDNTIENNELTDNKDAGVFVQGSRNTTVANNDFTDNAIGMEIDHNTNTTIEGNDVTGGFASILTEDSMGTKFISNTLRSYDGLGILIGGPKVANAKVLGNDISGGDFGIFVANSHRGSFKANKVHNNCAGMLFVADVPEPGNSVGNYEVKGNTIKDNTRVCPANEFQPRFSGIGILLEGARGMEVTGNTISGNVPTGQTAVSGGVVVETGLLFDGTTKPTNNAITVNDFGLNKPDIRWDGTGTGNTLTPNNCNTSVPARLCN